MSDLLDVVDNFERALSTLNDADAAVREGISMVHRQLLDVLTRYGAKRFDSLGEPFDYTQHQAISIFETPERPPQIVYDVFKEGYLLHDILLRPAMVIVTKAPAAKSNTDEATGEKAKAEAEDLDSSKEDTTSENAS